jgi:uncharacterized protein YbbC (DUF1343 family)
MITLKILFIPFLFLTLQSCTSKSEAPQQQEVRFEYGADQLIIKNLDLIQNKRLGIICNSASVLSNGTLLTDTLLKIKDINIIKIFAPEHGYFINNSAGEIVNDSSLRGITVYSLYGKNKKPTSGMLKNVEFLIYDLQDLGTRFYTYISTLYYVIEAASENNIPLIILDSPDPIGGDYVDGPILNDSLISFIGIIPIPIAYGMTPGELAKMIIGEKWIKSTNDHFKIIKMVNWRRENYFDDYNTEWINPSPNIPDLETAILYPGIALLEGTNISEGRGTNRPFKSIGAPFINSQRLIEELTSLKCTGINLTPASFIPERIGSKAVKPKYENKKCSGISLNITNRNEFNSVHFGIKLLYALHKLYPEKFKFNVNYFDKLSGDSSIRKMLTYGSSPETIIKSWQVPLNEFKEKRKKYLLY